MELFRHFGMASLKFGSGKTEIHPYRGLTSYGPYTSLTEAYNEISILHQPQNRADATRLANAFRNGLVPQFPGGFNKIFKTEIQVNTYELTTASDLEQIPQQFYSKFIENGVTGRLPLIIMDKTPKASFPSVYYDTKGLFIKEGIITQIATTQMLRAQDTFSWSVFPLAIQVYTKMGGIAYILYEKIGTEDSKSITFVVGTGISRIIRGSIYDSRYVGFALLFGPNGEWKLMKVDAREYRQDELASMFKSLVNSIATEIFNKYATETSVDRINLLIHYTGKNVSGIEERALWEASENVHKVYGKTVVPNILKINESTYRVMTHGSACRDKAGQDTGLVSVGTALTIKPKFYMLFTIGCVNVGSKYRPSGRGTPSPILVSVKDIGNQGKMDDNLLLKSVFDICRMNYTSINNPVNRLPTTVNYAHDIAYMMGKLGIRDLPESTSKRLWFI